jgi:hypothetical protein
MPAFPRSSDNLIVAHAHEAILCHKATCQGGYLYLGSLIRGGWDPLGHGSFWLGLVCCVCVFITQTSNSEQATLGMLILGGVLLSLPYISHNHNRNLGGVLLGLSYIFIIRI